MTQPIGNGQIIDYTWRDTLSKARCMAAYLKQQGLASGDRVAILSKNCAHWMMTDWAIWMAGYVSVPLYPTLAADTIRQILEHSEAKLLFVDDEERILTALRSVFRNQYNVFTASSGPEAM